MNKYLSVVLGVLFFVPSVSFAASLTQAQAESLINIVQASPGTPASAFTGLITAFSNISAAQANDLIGVIQSSPGTPASAFTGLITSFTADAPAQSSVVASSNPNSCNDQTYPACELGGTFTCTASGPSCVGANGVAISSSATQGTSAQSTDQILQNQIASDRQTIEQQCQSLYQNIENEYNTQVAQLGPAPAAVQGTALSYLQTGYALQLSTLNSQEVASLDKAHAQCAMEEANVGLTPPPTY